MKTLALILAALVTVTALAETPDQIAADYRAKAKTALEKVNATLEQATVPIIAELVKAGDTAGADEVKAQLKAKQDGEPVAKPHAKVANLFTLYDAARLRALDPIHQAAIRKLDAVLAGADGKKLEVVDAVKTVRAEVESGKLPAPEPAFPIEWTYHGNLEQKTPMAKVRFLENGDFEMTGTQPGKWKRNRAGDKITVTFKDRSTWEIDVSQDTAVVHRSDVGDRFLRRVSQPAASTTVQQVSK